MGSRHQAGNIEQFDGDGSPPANAGAIVGFAAVRDVISCTSTCDLEIAYRSLWVDRSEPGDGKLLVVSRKKPSLREIA